MLDENFFCFDSDNLEAAVTKLYGYGLCQDGIILDNENDYEKLSDIGAYVFVKVENDRITISQDYLGSFGLYFYNEDDYFAISNSFLKLVEHLRDNHKKITFNKSYADYYMSCKLTANLSSQTLVNEIEMLSKDLEITIDRKTNEITFNDKGLKENYVPINSKEALDILDNWFNRWIGIVRGIRKTTNEIVFDLSGGFDSRLASVIWLNANIDLTKVKIKSSRASNFAEDYSIASEIADLFNFKLNNDIFQKTVPIPAKQAISNFEYVKFGFEKQRYIRNFNYVNPSFRLSGHSGEILREYINKTPDEKVTSICRDAERLDPILRSSCDVLLNREFDEICEKYDFSDRSSKELTEIMYKHGRCRNHFGKDFVDSFLINLFTIAPLSDGDLQKINFRIGVDDDKLLVALIFKRYCPKLLDVKFCGNIGISPETLKFCDEINSIKEFIPVDYEFVDGPDVKINGSSQNLPDKESFDYIAEVFNSKQFKKEFEKYYPEDIYNKVRLNLVKGRDNRADIYSIVEIIKTIHDVDIANSNKNQDFNYWIDNYTKDETDVNEIEASMLCDVYRTSRIDIKNKGGSDNAIIIIENSDESSEVSFPDWFIGKDGKGCVIKSKKLSLDLKAKAVCDGQLHIKLRGGNLRDKNNKRVPVHINYTELTVDGEEIFNGNMLLTHDNVYNFKIPVKDSQIINIHIKWMPFTKLCEYETPEIDELEEKIRKQERKCKELEKELERVNNSKSGLLSKLKLS